MESAVTVEQALQVLIQNGLQVSTSSWISDFLSTLVATLVGAAFGGIITLWVNRKFEHDRLRIDNENKMYNDLVETLLNCEIASREAYAILSLTENITKLKTEFIKETTNKIDETYEKLTFFINFYKTELQDFEKDVLDIEIAYLEFWGDWKSVFAYNIIEDIHRATESQKKLSDTISNFKKTLDKHKKEKMYNKK